VVALQPLAAKQLLPRWRRKLRVIYQSVPRVIGAPSRARHSARVFRVVVVGHLRTVKDPLRAAYAVRRVPAASRLDVTHVGSALTKAWKRRAEHENTTNPRWHWLGETPLPRARRLIASSDLLVLSSRSEGGADVIGEACVAGVPIITTRIDGSMGLLGEGYPGRFEVGDTATLTRLLLRAENDERFLRELRRQCRVRASLFSEAREKRAWRQLLAELMPRSS
jgi:glycosyltransferase involved in cell wall biosynthesis